MSKSVIFLQVYKKIFSQNLEFYLQITRKTSFETAYPKFQTNWSKTLQRSTYIELKADFRLETTPSCNKIWVTNDYIKLRRSQQDFLKFQHSSFSILISFGSERQMRLNSIISHREPPLSEAYLAYVTSLILTRQKKSNNNFFRRTYHKVVLLWLASCIINIFTMCTIISIGKNSLVHEEDDHSAPTVE